MRLTTVEYNKEHWYMTVYLHCDYNLVRRVGGGSKEDWELVHGNFDVHLFDEWMEELLQKYFQSQRNHQ